MNVSARTKAGNYRTAISGIATNLTSTAVDVIYRIQKELEDLYYIDTSSTTTSTITKLITNTNYIGKKVESVRINANINEFITGGTFRIYGRRKLGYE